MYPICSHTNTCQLEVLPLGKHLGCTYLCVGMFYHASLWYAFTACLSCNNYKHKLPLNSLFRVIVQGASGDLSAGERFRMIPEMWYMASPRAASRQETRMLPSTKQTNFTVKDSKTTQGRQSVVAHRLAVHVHRCC